MGQLSIVEEEAKAKVICWAKVKNFIPMIFASRIKRKGCQTFDQPLQFAEIKTEDSVIERRIGGADDNLPQNFPGRTGIPEACRSGFETRRQNGIQKDLDKDVDREGNTKDCIPREQWRKIRSHGEESGFVQPHRQR